MRVTDIITEAEIDDDLVNLYANRGFHYIDTGYDQAAFIHPGTGWIIKIFGTPEQTSSPTKLSKGQQSLLDFAKYCQAHPDNPFLPAFKNPKLFRFKGKPYLKITMERLFQLWDDDNPTDIGVILAIIADEVRYNRTGYDYGRLLNELLAFADTKGPKIKEAYYELLSYLGEEGFHKLAQTIKDLHNIARARGYILDLHFKNFMYSSDGDIVISDPFNVIE